MKILVIQLARLGDIYMSWPAVRALRRKYPNAEIHILTRPRFASAFEGLTAVQKIIHLPTKDILSPLVQLNMDVPSAYEKLSTFIEDLNCEDYDMILNFSFSPLSSYITHFLTKTKTQVAGYTRFKDGFLCIPDDMSAYFYAQVGTQRPNRFHLVEIFASLIGSDLTPEDWRAPHPFPTTDKILPREYIVMHIGASEVSKSLPAQKWAAILTELFQQIDEKNQIPAILIGSESEKEIAQEIVAQFANGAILNFVGKTKLPELFPIIKGSKMLVGCDSAPMHMAAFTNTPCVNISLASVNFWETGPRPIGSVVVRFKTANDVSAEKVAKIIYRNIVGEKQDLSVIHAVNGTPSFWTLMPKSADFDWLLLRAIYLSENFPSNDSPQFNDAIFQMKEINTLMIQQMESVEKSGDVGRATPFIEQGEEVIETIGKLVPATQALIRWYQTEKIRIAPDEMPKVLARTLEIHRLLQKILDLYLTYQHEAKRGPNDKDNHDQRRN